MKHMGDSTDEDIAPATNHYVIFKQKYCSTLRKINRKLIKASRMPQLKGFPFKLAPQILYSDFFFFCKIRYIIQVTTVNACRYI